jgi:hypothetical protein
MDYAPTTNVPHAPTTNVPHAPTNVPHAPTKLVSVMSRPEHTKVVKTNRMRPRSESSASSALSTYTYDENTTPVSNLSAYYSPETFIKTCLFLVQSDNMFGQDDKRPMLYQIFWTSVQYIVGWVKPRTTVRGYPLTQNPNMSDGWYLMPPDFAGWATDPEPLFYDFDKFGNWSFAFAGNIGSRNAIAEKQDGTIVVKYHQIPPLNGVDSDFALALRWHFLNELKLAQNSIAQFSQIIDANYQKYMTKFKTKTHEKNSNLSNGHNNRGTVARISGF